MSESLQKAVEEMQAQLQDKLDEVANLKTAINTLCGVMGTEPLYADVMPEKATSTKGPTRPDIYYGKPVATAVQDYLQFVAQAAQPDDILRALEAGNFDFAALDWSAQNRLRNLSISLSKNTAKFRRLPNGMFGLNEWYEVIAPRRKRTKRPEAELLAEDDDAGEFDEDILEEKTEQTETDSTEDTGESVALAQVNNL